MDKKIFLQMRVGIFVSLGLLLMMVVIFLLGGEKNLFERQYFLYSRFDNISGLRLGASVLLAGITVGSVDDIKFPKDLTEKEVVVRLKITSKFRDRIREDSESSIATQGLLGDKMIQVTVGSPGVPELNDGALLKTKKTGASLEDVATRGAELMDEVKDLSKNVNTIVKDIQKKDSFLHSLIYDYQGKDIIGDLSRVTRSAQSMMREVQSGRGILHSLIYDRSDPQLAKNLTAAVDNMKKTTQNLKEVTGRIEKGEGSIGGLINDPTVYYDLKTLMGKANRSKLIKAVIRHTLSQNEKDTLK